MARGHDKCADLIGDLKILPGRSIKKIFKIFDTIPGFRALDIWNEKR